MKQPPVAWPVPEGPLTPPEGFVSDAAAVGIEFEPGDVERLGLFLALLLQANKATNLTAITEPTEAWRKHVLDALTLVPVIASLGSHEATEPQSHEGEESEGKDAALERGKGERHDPGSDPSWLRGSVAQSLSLVDIGSGGGVPAIPLAIVMPDVRFTLVEATKRKVEFLRHAAKTLKLKNVEILLARAEALGQDHKGHREKYDAAMARALGHLAIVCELCGPLVKPRGVVIAVKGAKADQELEESKKALGEIGLRHAQTLETPTGKLVLLEKTIRTPRMYPRRDGEPARVPIGMKKA